MKSASLTGNAMGKMLSAREIQFCEERRVSGGDFLLLKLAVLREERERALGLPQRTNVRQEIVDIKSALRSRMRTSGWLSASSIGHRGSLG